MDIVAYYAKHYSDGMVDLSSGSAPAEGVPLPRRVTENIEFVPPSGGADLRERIAARFRELGPDNIVLSAGASEALVAVASAFVKRGDVVAIDRGTYPSFTHAAERCGGRLARRPNAHLAPGVVLASICNPTVPDGQLRQLTAPSSLTVVDESHLDLVYNGSTPMRAADVSERYISVGGLSKGLGLGGLRIGWVACQDATVIAAVDRELQLLSGGPAGPSVEAAAPALDEAAQRCCETVVAALDNLPALRKVLDRAGWRYREPEAGLTMEVRPPGPVARTGEAAVRAAGYFLVPGRVYGTRGSYRVSLLAPPGELKRVLDLLLQPAPE